LLKGGGAFWALPLDQRYYVIVFGHGAGADFCAAERGAGVCEQANFLAIPALQQGVGKAAHEGIACAGSVHYVHFKGGNFGNFFGRGDEAAVRAESDGDDRGAHAEKRGGDLFVVAFAGELAGGGFAGLQDVHETESGAEFFLGAEVGLGEKAGGNVEIENDADFGIVRDLHRFLYGCDGELRSFGVEMLGGLNVWREAMEDLVHGNFSGDVGEHIDAAFAADIYGNPSQGGEFAFHYFDAGKIHAVFGEGFLDEEAVLIVAEEAEPAGADAEARDLREIVGGDAAGMDFHARGVDFFLGAEQARHDGEIIHGAAADSDDVNFCGSV
jgi:hypothetical protein